jgi:hypothetical protein
LNFSSELKGVPEFNPPLYSMMMSDKKLLFDAHVCLFQK